MKNYKISEKLANQIADFQSQPLKVGDEVLIAKKDTIPYNSMNWPYGGNSQSVEEKCVYKVMQIEGDTIHISFKNNETGIFVPVFIVIKKDDVRVGIKPLKSVMPRINFYNIDIESLISRAGYGVDGELDAVRNYEIGGKKMPHLSWNPFVLDGENNKNYYQRGFVWSLHTKQLLIESIYNGISLGTFVVRKRGWNELEKLIQKGHDDVAFYDIVDGKQRLNALIDFVGCKFPDLDGNYFSDFSEYAKRLFMNYGDLSYGELEENTPDKNVLKVFLNINYAGVQMSAEHLEFVKSIKL